MSHHEEITREEIKKEFQLERMILFSDAVFAIVITLMAIEIKLPESEHTLSGSTLREGLTHLLPVILAYIVSFIFIGTIWYQHLKIFGLLKDYDKGLVIRNLLLLFFVGLFPFSASLITKAKGDMLPFFIYILIILTCIIVQYMLHHYILVGKPKLRINSDVQEHLDELYKRKVAMIGFSISAILIFITYMIIPNKELKPMATLWMLPFPMIYRAYSRKKLKKK